MAVEDELRKLFSEGKITAVEFDRLLSLQKADAAAVPPPLSAMTQPPPPFVTLQPPPLAPPPAPPAPPPQPAEPPLMAIARQKQLARPDQPPRKAASSGKVWGIIIGIVATLIVVFAALVVIGLNAQTNGLSMGTLQSRGTVIDLTLSNTATTSGDVVLAVSQGQTTSMCEQVIAVQAQSNYDIFFDCPTLRDGPFEVRYLWAEYSDVAEIAQRIPMTN